VVTTPCPTTPDRTLPDHTKPDRTTKQKGSALHPRGPRNPRRVRYERETGADNRELALRFRDELTNIMTTMGSDAPDETERVVPLLRGGKCYFLVNNTMLHWDAPTKTAFRVVAAHDGERYEAWRHGKRIGNIHPPREAHWN
jgi:hypothetical protein